MKNKSKVLIVLPLLILILFFLILVILKFETISSFFFSDENLHHGEFLKFILTFSAGLIAIVGVYFGFIRAKAMEKNVQNQSEQIELNRLEMINQRFKTAIEHLGSEKEPIVLGSITELYELAINNEKYLLPIFNIFCRYIKTEAIKGKKSDEIKLGVIQAIIDYIFKNDAANPFKGLKADLSYCNFFSVRFNGLIFENVDLSLCSFSKIENCVFKNCSLKSSYFSIFLINNCVFQNSNLSLCKGQSIKFIHVHFIDIDEFDFLNLKFSECIFLKSKFINCNITGSKFYMCQFRSSTFQDCIMFNNSIFLSMFSLSEFIKCDISDSDFRATSFNNLKSKIDIFRSNLIGCFENVKRNPLTERYLDEIINKNNNYSFLLSISENTTGKFTIKDKEDVLKFKESLFESIKN